VANSVEKVRVPHFAKTKVALTRKVLEFAATNTPDSL